jgi:hypothetical protein
VNKAVEGEMVHPDNRIFEERKNLLASYIELKSRQRKTEGW